MNVKLGFWLGVFALFTISVSPSSLSAQEATEAANDAQGFSQVLGMATTPRLIPDPGLKDYLDAFALTHSAGVNGNAVTEKWSTLEPATGININGFIDGLNSFEDFYPDTVLMGIQVINTTAKETPADLLNVPFDDPQMLQRFEALFDKILVRLDHDVRYLSIGNEVDVYLGNHPEEWATYKTFYDGAVAYVHGVAPSIQVGVTATYGGSLDYTDEVSRLNEHSDALILTYYPLGTAFTANNPDAPLTDFPQMVALADGLPVVLQEVGYPSAELLDSSEAEQADFIHNVFTAWQAQGDAIPFLDIFLLHDLTEQICSKLEDYYGLKHANFHAYLCTLGLRASDGTPKLAWDAFVEEATQWRNR